MQNRFKKAGEIDYTPQFILVSTCWQMFTLSEAEGPPLSRSTRSLRFARF